MTNEISVSVRRLVPPLDGYDDVCPSSCGTNGDECLEKYVLLNEIRADALREAGLYDVYIRLCQQALQQVGTFAFHERLFDNFTLLACDEVTGYRAESLCNSALLERQRPALEEEAATDFEARFGAEPLNVTAVHVRSNCCNEIWHAVVCDAIDGSREWYQVEFLDDGSYLCAYLDHCDVESDDRYSIIEDLSRIEK